MRPARRIVFFGRQNPTDVIGRPGDWFGLGRRVVIAPHANAPLPAPPAPAPAFVAPPAPVPHSVADDLRTAAKAAPLAVTPRGRGRPSDKGRK